MYISLDSTTKWRPLSLSELTPNIFNIELAHLGLEASIKEKIYISTVCVSGTGTVPPFGKFLTKI